MDVAGLVDISTETIWVIIKIALPILLAALIVGLIVSLFQALTQIQEPTLSFVPKIIVVFLVILLTLNYMGGILQKFTEDIMIEITNID